MKCQSFLTFPPKMNSIILILLGVLSPCCCILFNGPCPAVQRNLTQIPESLSHTHLYTAYHTKIVSKINHLFYSLVEDSVALDINLLMNKKNDVVVRKFDVVFLCNIEEYLEFDALTGWYRHKIFSLEHGKFFVNERCGSFWDRYQVLFDIDTAVLWGCVNHMKERQHEEAVYAIQWGATDVLKWFPVGRITRDHLMPVATGIPTESDGSTVAVDCQRMKCKPEIKKRCTHITEYVAIFAGVTLIGYIIYLRVEKYLNGAEL